MHVTSILALIKILDVSTTYEVKIIIILPCYCDDRCFSNSQIIENILISYLTKYELTFSFSMGRPNMVVAYEFICSVYCTFACFLSPSKLAIFNLDKTPGKKHQEKQCYTIHQTIATHKITKRGHRYFGRDFSK